MEESQDRVGTTAIVFCGALLGAAVGSEVSPGMLENLASTFTSSTEVFDYVENNRRMVGGVLGGGGLGVVGYFLVK